MEPSKQELVQQFPRAMYLAFGWFGVALLLPYSCFLAAVDYYSEIFDVSFMFALAQALMIPNLVVLSLKVVCGQFPDDHRNIVSGFSCLVLAMLIIPFCNARILVLGVAVMASACIVLVQGSITAIASQYGQGLPSVLQAGQGFAGVLAPLLRVLCKLVTSQMFASVCLFYFLAAAVEISALLLWHFKSHIPGFDNASRATLAKQPLLPRREDVVIQEPPRFSQLALLSRLRWLLLAVFWNFAVTMALFPGILSEMRGPYNGPLAGQEQGVLSVALVGVFGVSDSVGKYLPSYRACRIKSVGALVLSVVVRTMLVPLFLWLRTEPRPVVILCVATAVLGVTCGLFGSMTFELIPNVVGDEPEDLGRAGTAVLFFLIGGLAIGTVLASVVATLF